jgi:hypothetical protein
MTFKRVPAAGEIMTDDKIQPESNDQPELAKPKPSGQETQQGQAELPDASAQGTLSRPRGRKPLFRS